MQVDNNKMVTLDKMANYLLRNAIDDDQKNAINAGKENCQESDNCDVSYSLYNKISYS